MTTPNPLSDLTVHDVLIEDLVPYAGNARRGNLDAVAESLKVNGQYRPLVVRAETNEILAGNHTAAAAKALGWTTILVTYLHGLTDSDARRIVLVDNRTNDLATYDDDALAALLAEMDGDFLGTGYDEDALNDILGIEPPDVDGDPEDVPEPPTYTPLTKTGDVYELGPNRLVVGDSTDADVLALALHGKKADLLLTDPPYNVAYTGGTKDALTIENDSMSDTDFLQFLVDAFHAANENLNAGCAYYVFHGGAEVRNFWNALEATGFEVKQTLQWIKDRFVLSRSDYHWQNEPILYGWKSGAAHRWYGGFTPANIFDDAPDFASMKKDELVEILTGLASATDAIRADRPARNADHPTAKPVNLLVKLIENSSLPGDLILEPFGGSGATLIAAHMMKRRCGIVELDPRYADVIARRWQQVTGIKPIKDGVEVDFIAHHEAHEAEGAYT